MAGVRAEDILTLKWPYVGKTRIQYEMEKTGAQTSIKITPQIQEILTFLKP
jgi:hypothetical protein